MNSSIFKRLVNKHFAPRIKQIGWVGSGFNYRRTNENHVIDYFGMYGSWMGGRIYCETGIHFDFLPLYQHDKTIEKKSVTECLFRERLSTGTWEFYSEEVRNIKQVENILETFLRDSSKFYSDFENFPAPFDKISVEHLRNERHYKLLGKYEIFNMRIFARLMKDIHLFLGNIDKAKDFSEYGIERVNELAKEMLVGRKTKTYRLTEETFRIEIENLRLK
ncbi:DUF4304 domain-containing protein [Croceitalea rosinachiae]|uniref:DUF4304 domain-containing protein n=1 Tax=Croceitalea rosinachiae TaxID=3075596 RepID=A0ABU3ACZ2_9FLAO|nr:DUF4304 domain-containing protein [Croceitalea sp. F388]MDT0608048.1 hypothetical protein [Croceitalea sp. F388]